MAEVPTWTMFAYMDADERNDERRALAEWQVLDVVRWAMARGYETIYLRRGEETAEFRKADPVPGIRHYLTPEP